MKQHFTNLTYKILWSRSKTILFTLSFFIMNILVANPMNNDLSNNKNNKNTITETKKEVEPTINSCETKTEIKSTDSSCEEDNNTVNNDELYWETYWKTFEEDVESDDEINMPPTNTTGITGTTNTAGTTGTTNTTGTTGTTNTTDETEETGETGNETPIIPPIPNCDLEVMIEGDTHICTGETITLIANVSEESNCTCCTREVLNTNSCNGYTYGIFLQVSGTTETGTTGETDEDGFYIPYEGTTGTTETGTTGTTETGTTGTTETGTTGTTDTGTTGTTDTGTTDTEDTSDDIEGIFFELSIAEWQECADGSANFSAVAGGTNGDVININIDFYGGTNTPPDALSPKENSCENVSSNDWTYYPVTVGSFTSAQHGTYTITRRGPSFQVGNGANNTALGFGGSGWFDIEGGDGYYAIGDINVMLGELICEENNEDVSFEWSNGATTSSIEVKPTVNTSYTVTVTDCNDCIATNIVNINVSNLEVSLEEDQIICEGETVTLTPTVTGVSECIECCTREVDNTNSCDGDTYGIFLQVTNAGTETIGEDDDCCQSHGDHDHINAWSLRYVGPTSPANIEFYSSGYGTTTYNGTHSFDDVIFIEADDRFDANSSITVNGSSFNVHTSCSEATNAGFGINSNGDFVTNPNPNNSNILFIIEGLSTPQDGWCGAEYNEVSNLDPNEIYEYTDNFNETGETNTETGTTGTTETGTTGTTETGTTGTTETGTTGTTETGTTETGTTGETGEIPTPTTLQGIFFELITTTWEECSNGTATFMATAIGSNGDFITMNVSFSGQTTTTPDALSPINNNCGDTNSTDWIYYPTTTGTLVSTQHGTYSLTRRGASFQIGNGANTTSLGFGGSGWFDIEGGDGYYAIGDINIMLGELMCNTNNDLTYNWSNGATTPSIEVVPDSTTTYSVTITDCTGCSKTDEVTITVGCEYDLSLIKILAPDQEPLVEVGDTVSFIVKVTNQGDMNSGDFTVVDRLPNGMSFVSASDEGMNNNNLITWNLSDLNQGEFIELSIQAQVDELGDGVYINWAEISSDSGDDDDSTPDTNTGNGDIMPNDLVDNHNDMMQDNSMIDEDDNDFEEIFIDRGPSVSSRIFLQGAADNTANGNIIMRDDLRTDNLLPMSEPYTLLGFEHVDSGGGEVISTEIYNQTGEKAIVDWIIMEIRDPQIPSQIITTQSALVQRNGDVVNTNGDMVSFENIEEGEYYIAIRHRNHLGVMTSEPIYLSKEEVNTTFIDFTNPNTVTYGEYAQKQMGNRMALWAGNGNNDGGISFQGDNNDNNTAFFEVLTAPNNTTGQVNYIYNGYNTSDYGLDCNSVFQGNNNEPNIPLFNVLTHPDNNNNLANYKIIEQLP